MRKRICAYVVCVASVLNIAFLSSAFGGALDNPLVGIKGTGMGVALAGIADDASAVFYNPAGMAFQNREGWQAELYVTYILSDMRFKANSLYDSSDEGFILQGFFVSKTFDKWAFGFGGYIPYAGGRVSYDRFQGSPFKLESSAGWNAFTGAISYRLSPTLSVGGGLSVYVGEMKNRFFDPGLGAMVENKYNGYSGYGGHLGLFYKPVEKLGIGLVIRSEVPIEMEGRYSTPAADIDSEVEFTLPYYFTFGLGYKPFRNITLGFSVTYQMWGDLDKLTFTTANIETDQRTDYTDSWLVGIGIEYVTPVDLTIRAGVIFRQNSTKAKGLVPASSDVDQMVPSIGFAYNMTGSIETNFTVMRAIGFEREYNSQKFNHHTWMFIFGIRKNY